MIIACCRGRANEETFSYATIFDESHRRGARLPRFLHCAVLLLLAGSVLAQSGPGKKAAKAQVVPETVNPDDMVIVVRGACQTPPGEFAVRDCIRGVTREEFEALVAATNPNATPENRQKLAENLGRVIVLSNEAKKRGLPKDPKVRELLRMVQLQELAGLLLAQSAPDSASNVPDPEVEEFYKSHLADYRSAEMVRLTIPRKDPADAAAEDATYAEAIRSRCAAGEDPAKLQSEAAQRVSKSVTTPDDLKSQRPAQYTDKKIFDMKPGECVLIASDKSDFLIYKMVAITEASLNEVRGSIVKALASAKMKNELDSLMQQNVITLNGKYFPAPPTATPAPNTPK